ncbi:phenylacetate--CoA ligase family protein [Plantactinospora sp. GCM10030261]|uniref:phenylacetate--CoA ligase family protein n=1 Tax=Plantactinospora sp. GCM10030261 TaxID=3273420 RepID=UPI003620C8C9
MSSGLAVAVRELRHALAAWRADAADAELIRTRALNGINEMLSYCRARVPYYRDGDYPDEPLTSLAELARLPSLTKPEVLRAGVDRFRTPGLAPGRYHRDVTSGSTGVRLEVWHDVDAYGYHGATVLRRFLRSGYRPWWRIAHIKPYPRPVRWFQRLGLFPRVVIPAGQPEAALARQVLATRPGLIMGYPVMLRALLHTFTDAELTRLRRTLRMVMTDSELLTDEVAALLAEGFGVPVFDEYSAHEVLTVSTQCRHGALHVDEDRVWLEIVDDQGRPVPPGTTGSVVVTHYRERAMPLVRYALGDRARLLPDGDCPCGSAFRRMRLVDGRVNDFVTLPGGRRVYSAVFLGLAKQTPGLAECMVRQDASGQITVHLIPEPGGDLSFDQVVTAFQNRFDEEVAAGVRLRFERAERVALTAGGKGRFVESAYRPDTGHHPDTGHRPDAG